MFEISQPTTSTTTSTEEVTQMVIGNEKHCS